MVLTTNQYDNENLTLYKMKIFFQSFTILLLGTSSLMAQLTSFYTEPNRAYKRSAQFYEQELFAQSIAAAESFTNQEKRIDEETFRSMKMRAEVLRGKATIMNQRKEGEVLMTDFIRNYSPDPESYQAAIVVGNYYFNTGNHQEAIEYYNLVDFYNLSPEDQSELIFKKGYSYFVNKEFALAKGALNSIKDRPGKYLYPANYYLGMAYYFEEDLASAEKSLRVAEQSKSYQPYIPFYVSQILFNQQKYNDLVDYAEPRIEQRGLRKSASIKQLLGRAYFELGNYAKSLAYLEAYAEKTRKMMPEDFYQLGYLHYLNKNHTEAVKYLSELMPLETPLAQSGQYLLGNSYLEMNNKNDALSAFNHAAQLEHDLDLRKESQWNYAKLSYELNRPDVINTLKAIDNSHPYYQDAQILLSTVLLNTRDMDKALTILSELESPSPEMDKTYQKVLYIKGVQLFKEEKFTEARSYLLQAQEKNYDLETEALANFWLGEIAYIQNKPNSALTSYTKFINKSRNLNDLPDESNIATAHYTMGYIQLKEKQYQKALHHFEKTTDYIKRNSNRIESAYVREQILGDAILRKGDCYFVSKQYSKALQNYDEAVQRKYSGYVYALFQKAMILGLKDKPLEKVIALEKIASNHPESQYADDALFNAGVTYHEQNDLDNAQKPYLRLIENFKSSVYYNRTLLRLGLLSQNKGVNGEAIRFYKMVFNQNPTNDEATSALEGLKRIYVNDLGRPDDYVNFKNSLPGYSVEEDEREKLAYETVLSRYSYGKHDLAVFSANEYLQNYKQGRHALNVLFYKAESLGALNKWEDSYSNYKSLVAKGPSAFYGKSLEKSAYISFYKLKNPKEAIDLYEKLSKNADSDELKFEGMMGVLKTAYELKNKAAILAFAPQVINNNIATEEDKALANFYQAKVAYEAKDIKTALHSFNQTIRLSELVIAAESRYMIAKIYAEMGDLENASKMAEMAYKQNGAYKYWLAKSILLSAEIRYQNKDYYNAEAELKQLIIAYKEDPALINEANVLLKKVQKTIENESNIDANSNQNSFILEDQK